MLGAVKPKAKDFSKTARPPVPARTGKVTGNAGPGANAPWYGDLLNRGLDIYERRSAPPAPASGGIMSPGYQSPTFADDGGGNKKWIYAGLAAAAIALVLIARKGGKK